MQTINQKQSDSVMPTETQGTPTIGAKQINPQSVANPIRRRFRSLQVVWYLLGVIEILLILRFILKFIGANESAGFTQFIYVASSLFAAPFTLVVDSSQVGKSVFDWSILLAIVIYALVAWGVVKLLVMSKPISDQESHSKLDSQA